MNNILFNNTIIDPSIELRPTIRISPFNAEYIYVNEEQTYSAEEYLRKRFNNYVLTVKGRDAIDLALSYYNLKKDDIVTILTTSNNFYISSCVTKTIEKYCLWSREISNKTKVIFVNHEFGYPYQNLQAIKDYNIPIIEDCAHSFISQDREGLVGNIGDFAIYSLPKFFPMQLGGILSVNKEDLNIANVLDVSYKEYILKNISYNVNNLNDICNNRLKNYCYLKEQLRDIGIYPVFEENDKTIPGVFLFCWHSNINYSLLKEFMQSNGVECSVFYGKNAFFIPVHHNLTQAQLDYMISLLKYFYYDLF